MASVLIIAGVTPTWDERTPVPAHRNRIPWDESGPQGLRVRLPWRSSNGLQAQTAARWLLPWLETGYIDRSTGMPYGAYGAVMPVKIYEHMNPLTVTDQRTRALWGKYGVLNPARVATYWGEVGTADFRRIAPWGTYQPSPNVPTSMPWAAPAATVRTNRIPWGKGVKPYAPRGTTIIDVNLPPPAPTPGLHIVGNLKVYYQMNIAMVSRLPEMTPLNFKSIRISVDVDSFGARWSGTLDSASYDLIRPAGSTRHEIEMTLNGHVWHLLVETPGKSFKFGQGDYQVSGRGLVGELAEPHAQPRGSCQRLIGRYISWLKMNCLIPTGRSAGKPSPG